MCHPLQMLKSILYATYMFMLCKKLLLYGYQGIQSPTWLSPRPLRPEGYCHRLCLSLSFVTKAGWSYGQLCCVSLVQHLPHTTSCMFAKSTIKFLRGCTWITDNNICRVDVVGASHLVLYQLHQGGPHDEQSPELLLYKELQNKVDLWFRWGLC